MGSKRSDAEPDEDARRKESCFRTFSAPSGDLDHRRSDVGAAEIERHESAALGARWSADEGWAHRDGASVPGQTAAHLGLEDGD